MGAGPAARLSRPGPRNPPWLPALPPGAQQFPLVRKCPASSRPPPAGSMPEESETAVSPVRGRSVRPARGRWRRGGEAVVTGLPRELAPLLALPGGDSLVAGGGLTLPPLPRPPYQGRAPFHTQLSCPLASALPEWPLYEQHSRTRRDRPERPQEAHLDASPRPPRALCAPWQRGAAAHRLLSLCSGPASGSSRARASKLTQRPAPPPPPAHGLDAAPLLGIDVQLVCTPARPHCHVILLSTYGYHAT